MDLKDVQNEEEEPKNININIKTTKSIFELLKYNNVSPTKLFHKAVEELRPNLKIRTTKPKDE